MQHSINKSHPLLAAVAVHVALTRELDWLRIAARSYNTAAYRRLVRHSASRLHWTIKHQMRVGCAGVQFRIHPTIEKPDRIDVDIVWTGRRGESVLRAWFQVMNPDSKA
jgi:hypothetical protein